MRKLILMFLFVMIYLPAKAQLTGYKIDGNTNSFDICNTNGNMTVECKTPFQGAPKIVWTLYKDGNIIKSEQHNKSFRINGTDMVTFSVPKLAGSYRVERRYKNIVGTTFGTNTIVITLNNSGFDGPAFTINNSLFAITKQDIYYVNLSSPIILNASISCPVKTNFFVSIQLSDIYWSRYNQEAMNWFNSNSNLYGSISSFNLKSFAQNNGITFTSGQYYRVTIAFGSPWQSITRLIKIN